MAKLHHNGLLRFQVGVVGLIVTLLCLTTGTNASNDCCQGARSYLRTDCWGLSGCPAREDAYQDMVQRLESTIFGQPDAIERILSAFRAVSRDRPRVLHFSGDNGVGKTWSAFKIAEALFCSFDKNTQLPRGLLYLRGNHYRVASGNDTKAIEQHRSDITRAIHEHVKECPRGIVVFDEAELPHRHVMNLFEELFDSRTLTWGQSQIRLTEATFVLISDFGVEGTASRWPLAKLDKYIADEIMKIWRSAKHAALMTTIVPFVSMLLPDEESLENYTDDSMLFEAPPAVRRMVDSLLLKLFEVVNLPNGMQKPQVKMQPATLARLQDLLYTRAVTSTVDRSSNYRGIERKFRDLVVAPVTRKLYSFRQRDAKSVVLVLQLSDDLLLTPVLQYSLDSRRQEF